MKKKKEDLIEAIQAAAGRGLRHLPVMRAKVESVDESKYMITAVSTADIGSSEKPMYKASLRASVISGDLGFIIVPEAGSIVALAFAHNDEQQAVVIACSKIAKVIITVKTSIELKIDGSAAGKLKIDTEGIDLGGAAEPMVLGDTLKGWCQQMTLKVNEIIAWAKTGIAPSGGDADIGGIAPYSGGDAPAFPTAALSTKHRAD